jgi:hypothetical protein
MKLLFGTILLFAASTTGQPPIPSDTVSSKPCQRFVPIAPDPTNRAIPWHGFFALDTETGQICLTTIYHKFDAFPGFDNMPTCVSLVRSK